jgi:hypothetical protein
MANQVKSRILEAAYFISTVGILFLATPSNAGLSKALDQHSYNMNISKYLWTVQKAPDLFLEEHLRRDALLRELLKNARSAIDAESQNIRDLGPIIDLMSNRMNLKDRPAGFPHMGAIKDVWQKYLERGYEGLSIFSQRRMEIVEKLLQKKTNGELLKEDGLLLLNKENQYLGNWLLYELERDYRILGAGEPTGVEISEHWIFDLVNKVRAITPYIQAGNVSLSLLEPIPLNALVAGNCLQPVPANALLLKKTLSLISDKIKPVSIECEMTYSKPRIEISPDRSKMTIKYIVRPPRNQHSELVPGNIAGEIFGRLFYGISLVDTTYPTEIEFAEAVNSF